MTTTQAESKTPQKVEKPTTPAAQPVPSKPDQPQKVLRTPKAPPKVALRFSPTAWAKLLYFRDLGDTEVGGFGIAAKDDLLRIEDFVTIRQKVGMASVSFEDEAVAEFFEAQVDAGRKPEEFARIWLHTHPGDSPQPSMVDEETFERVFGRCDWAVMFVLGRGGKTYARLRFNVGPGGEGVIPVEVDYGQEFGPSDHEVWETEYRSNILAGASFWPMTETFGSSPGNEPGGYLADDWLDSFEAMDLEDRQLILDELAARPDLWQEESEVMPW